MPMINNNVSVIKKWLDQGGDLSKLLEGYNEGSFKILKEKVDLILKDAPEDLDTFKELAELLNSNKADLETILKQLGNKVDKEKGKGLFPNADMNKIFDGYYEVYIDEEAAAGETAYLSAIDDAIGFGHRRIAKITVKDSSSAIPIWEENYILFETIYDDESYSTRILMGLEVGKENLSRFLSVNGNPFKRIQSEGSSSEEIEAIKAVLNNKVDKVNGKNPINFISTDLTYLSAPNVCDEILNQEEKQYVEGLNLIYNQYNEYGLFIASEYYGTYVAPDGWISILYNNGAWDEEDWYINEEALNEYLSDYVLQDDFDATVENIEQDIEDLKDSASAINVITMKGADLDYTKLTEMIIPNGISIVYAGDGTGWIEDYALVIKSTIEDDEHLTIIMANGEIHTNFHNFNDDTFEYEEWQGWTTPYVSTETFNSTIGDIQSLLDNTISLADSYIGEVTE